MKLTSVRSTVVSAGIFAAATAGAQAKDINVGIIVGFTGPAESIAPGIAQAAQIALKEVSDSGLFLDGAKLNPVTADSTCIDASAATTAAERLVSAEKVAAIVGADCSGVTTAILQNVTAKNGVVMISPSATSPALTDIEDNGYFFRIAPSDARQGAVLAEVVKSRGHTIVAVTYTNNDYGKGFADAFEGSFKALGGTIALSAPHDDGKGDYSAEVGALSATDASLLVVLGYADQGGLGILRSAIDTAAFGEFALGDGMYTATLLDELGTSLDGSFGTLPRSGGDGVASFERIANANGMDPNGLYRREGYDAAALIALAMQKAGSTDSDAIRDSVWDVANAPGTPILPGELAHGLQILSDGGEIDYIGASSVELIEPGEAAGKYIEFEVQSGSFRDVKVH